MVDGDLEDSFEVVFLFLVFGIMGGNEASDSSGDAAFLFLVFGIIGDSEESGISGDTAFLFLLTLALDPAGLSPLIARLAAFATGEADVVSDNLLAILEAALKRADRLGDMMKFFDNCREKYLVDEGMNIGLNDRTRGSLITEL